MNEITTLTCIYCGHEYPAGTPATGDDVAALTSHIKVCDKHPLRIAEAKIKLLRRALETLVGASTKDELEMMEDYISATHGDDDDKCAAKVGIQALLQTLPDEPKN